MDDENEILREFDALLYRQFEGELSDRERGRLREMVREHEEVRRHYLRHCQMHAMLEDERSGLLKEIAQEGAPKNVVALPGMLLRSQQDEVSDSPASGYERSRVAHGRYAAVAIVMIGLIIAGKRYIIESEREREAVAVVAGSDEWVAGPLSPEEEYREGILALADAGSQNRPPTPFASDAAGGVPDEIDFSRDVRPILSDNCFLCHGPSEEDREADLRLDTPEGIVADLGGYQAVVPGDPGESVLVERILTSDSDEVMPPPKSHKKLTSEQKEILQRWIAQGGEWRDHWAFEAVERPDLPVVEEEGWVRNEIDQFILGRLEKEGLRPAGEADRRTLIRRTSLDLTGLPATPERVEAFVSDESPEAYGKLIDEFLASKQYGEHRARYWLDAARYGDTHGLHLDNYREIWPYRDWVIGAFNANMPFDEFTVEQLAGDLLPDPSQDQLVATGFNRCNVTTSEGGSIAEEYAVRYAVDRVATTSTVWMGLTTGCAVCHDHKYDRISQAEFYKLAAYFNNTTQEPMDGNVEDTPPVVRLYESPEDEAKERGLSAEIRKVEGRLGKLRKEAEPAFTDWLEGLSPEEAREENQLEELAGQVLAIGAADLKALAENAAGEELTELKEGADIDFGKERPFTMRLRFRYPENKRGRWVLVSKTDDSEGERGVRVVLDDQGVSVELIEEWPERALQMVAQRGYSAGDEKEIFVTYDGSGKAEGIMVFNGGKELGSRFNLVRNNVIDENFDSGAPFRVALPGCYAKEPGVGLSGFEFYDRQLSDDEILVLSKEKTVPGLLTKAKAHLEKEAEGELPGRSDLLAYYLYNHSAEYAEAMVERARLNSGRDQVLSRTTTTLVMNEKEEEAMAYILERGEYDKRGEEVRPGVPEVLPGLPSDAPPNRLGLAQWLVDPNHPLTARVTVNRMWQELFGTGIVKTSEDFGTQGEPPSHPELLDWLASEFVESGWDVKAIYKKMMLSATYRQDSAIRPGLAQRDSENRLLARGPRFRLDAETIRDQALFVSGLLVDRVGGPSVKPYQPAGLWKTIGYSGSNTVEFHQDHGEALYRRSLYTFWKRTSHPPNMAAFDAPNRESCIVRRERTNTPLQALVLMNDPQFVEAARHLAERVLMEDHGNLEDRIFRLVVGRPASKDEGEIVASSLRAFREIYTQDRPAAAALVRTGGSSCVEGIEMFELAAWTMLANQLLNLDEVINKN